MKFHIILAVIINIVYSIIKLFSNNLFTNDLHQISYNISTRISNNNSYWGEQQSSPELESEPDIIINDNSVVILAELIPDIEEVKEEYNEEIKNLYLKKKELLEINKELIRINKQLEKKNENIKLEYEKLLIKYKKNK
tara:strand:- start:4 stop:417 length:414 start_codon:yes stop_codon:yes gene_type:complete